MRGFGWFSRSTEASDRSDIEIARNGSPPAQWALAEREDLSREVFLILAGSSDLDVLRGLALNEATPADILDGIAEHDVELHGLAATNWSASPALKKTVPIADHVEGCLEAFLDQVNATDDERRRLFIVARKPFSPGGPLLGEAWHQIRPEQS